MTVQELDAIMGGIAPVMRELLAIERLEQATVVHALKSEIKALEMRLLEVETRPAVIGPQGERGPQGLSPSLEMIINGMLPLMPKAEKGEPGQKGIDGAAGKDAHAVDTSAIITAVLAQLPAPEQGAKGDDGAPGKDAPAVDVNAIIAEVLKRVPAPVKGDQGDPGIAGKDAAGLRTGIGPPTADGHIHGDTYLDIESGDLYQCR